MLSCLFFLINIPSFASQARVIIYTIPQNGEKDANPGTILVFRFNAMVNPTMMATLDLSVAGSKSGNYQGNLVLTDDQKTIIYKPIQPFAFGEEVSLKLSQKIVLTFTTSKSPNPRMTASNCLIQTKNRCPLDSILHQ